jgi:cell shape-determining protein MreC
MPDVFKLVTLLVGVISIAKVLWAVAEFFIGMSKTLKSLTSSVEKLTERFEAHYADVSEDLADARERIAALEAWREVSGS